MKILYLLNSDFGVSGTVGMRAMPTAKEIIKKDELIIFCRDHNNSIDGLDVRKVVPFASLPMKIINGIKIYIYKSLKSVELNTYLFEFFLRKKLDNLNLDAVDIVHSWDFLPNTFEYIKKRNPNIKIIKDMTMAFSNVLKDHVKTEKYWDTITDKPLKIELDSLNFIDYFILPSEITKESLLKVGVKENQILYIPYGVDYNKFKIVKKRFDGKFKVAFAGNVSHRKGVGYLIDAWKKLGLKNAELNLYGRVYPEILEYLKDKEKYNIKTNGFVDLKKELPKNHILVHPSLLETTPKTLKEAMASGLTVITTFHSGPDFKDGREGFIIKEQNSDEIAEKLNYFYKNRKELEIFSKRARKFAEKKNWDDYGKEVYNSYNKILR